MRTPVRTLRRSLTAIAGTLLLGAGSAHAAPPPTEVIGKPSLKGAGNVYGYPDGAVTARVCGQVAPVRNTDVLTCPPDWKLSDPSGADTAGRELRLYAVPEPGWKHAGWENCPALDGLRGCSLYAAQGTTERFAPVALFEDDRSPDVTGLVAGPSATRDRTVVAEWGATEASTYRCSIDGGGLAPCAPPFTFDAADGTHQFVVQATDLNGLKSSPTRITVEMVDTELVTAPVDGCLRRLPCERGRRPERPWQHLRVRRRCRSVRHVRSRRWPRARAAAAARSGRRAAHPSRPRPPRR